MKMLILGWFSLMISFLTGCVNLKPAPIAAGSDPLVVNAERAQRSSLEVFRLVTAWETRNRLSLPPEVSKAVDVYRKDFPGAWNESRLALKQYKIQAGTNATTLQSVTVALLVAETALLNLKTTGSITEAQQASVALQSLIDSISIFFSTIPQPPAAPVLPTTRSQPYR